MYCENLNQQDRLYIEALRSGNPVETHRFFYSELAPLIETLRIKLFQGQVSYDELVSELYIYLSSDSWHKLDTFAAIGGCRLKSWVSAVAWRFFMRRKISQTSVQTTSDDTQAGDNRASDDDINIQISLDVRSVLQRMPNRRYARVLTMLMLEGFTPAETAKKLGTTTANIYNMKRRAIEQFIKCFI